MIRVRRAANSSSSRTDHEASASLSAASRVRTSRRSPAIRSASSGCSSAVSSAASGSRSCSIAGPIWATAPESASVLARPTTSPTSASPKAGKPLSRSRAWSPSTSLVDRRTELSANGRSTSPIDRRWRSSISTMRRHSGYMSTFVTATRTGGPARIALARNSSSGPDSSAEASVTKTRASADGRNASVAAACPAFRPPTPGVSTSEMPRPRNAFGRPTSTSSTPGRRSASSRSSTQARTSSAGIDSMRSSPASRRRTVAVGRSA